MDMKQAIDAVTRYRDLSLQEMRDVMSLIMSGAASPSQISGFLIGLRMKGETVDEIAGAAQVMREMAERVNLPTERLVDIVGTGGDDANLFNVSTCTSFVVAAAGGRVAKHGNRSVSSSSGSADLLEAAGVNLDLNAEQVTRCIQALGVGFMFAPKHHSAMKHVVIPRTEMGVRTIFNILGPLTNPAFAQHQLLGTYNAKMVSILAQVLAHLGLKHALVVSSKEGLDEISIAQPTQVAELKKGKVIEYTISPEDFGLQAQSLDPLRVTSPQESLVLVRQVLDNQPGAALDMVLMNAGAALYAADIATSIGEGIELARDAVASGQAKEKLSALVNFTQSLKT